MKNHADSSPLRSVEDMFGFFDSLANFEKGRTPTNKRSFRLDRMLLMLDAFGNPHRAFRSVHVAGTKGKGSTAALLGSALQAGGYRTGLYSSPHVVSYVERFSVGGKPPDSTRLIALADRLRLRLADFRNLPGGFGPTTFEVLTLLAMLLFRDSGCEFAVLETGIGGRLDATNVILPEAAVITPLDLEHTDLLGNSMAEIAAEKAGIIKPGVPAFCGRSSGEAEAVFRKIAGMRGSPLYLLDEEVRRIEVEPGWDGTDLSLTLRGEPAVSFRLALLGSFQAENAALAYLALRKTVPHIPLHAIRKGFSTVTLPGRWEVLRREPPVILDAAHTPLAVERLLETFRQLCPVPGILLFGSVEGKRVDRMAELLCPHFSKIVISTPGSFKSSDPDAVYSLFRSLHGSVHLLRNPREALETALSMAEGILPTLVTGSFYMLSEIRRIWLADRGGAG